MIEALDQARLLGASHAADHFNFAAMQDAYLVAFRAHGMDLAKRPPAEVVPLIRSSPILDALIAALNEWARHAPKNVTADRLYAVARAVETDPGRASVRDAISRRDWDFLRRLANGPEARRQLGPRLREIFDALWSLNEPGDLALLEAICREHPDDFWFHEHLGLTAERAMPPRTVEAVLHFTAAVAIRPASAAAHANLTVSLLHRGDHERAVVEFREAVRLAPALPSTHDGLGTALEAASDRDAAMAEYREAIRLVRMSPEQNPNFGSPHAALGKALEAGGDHNGAITEYREAIRRGNNQAGVRTRLGMSFSSSGTSTKPSRHSVRKFSSTRWIITPGIGSALC